MHSKKVMHGNLPLYITLVGLAIMIVAYFLLPEFQEFVNNLSQILINGDREKLKALVEDFGWVGPLILVFIMVFQMFLIVVPTVIMMVASILAYGPLWGSLIVLLGIFFCSTVGYYIGKYLGKRFIFKLIGKEKEDKMEKFIQKYGFWAVVISRINPFLSIDAISFVCGVVTMSFWRFIAATFIGIIPLTAYIAIIGQSTETLKSGLLWGSGVCLLVFIGYVVWDKQKSKESN